MLSAVVINTSTASNLIIISQLHHFTFVSALLLPVLHLNLTLPFRLQGLATGGWLDLTRQDFPAIYNQLTKASRFFFHSLEEISLADFSARTIASLYQKQGFYERKNIPEKCWTSRKLLFFSVQDPDGSLLCPECFGLVDIDPRHQPVKLTP